MIPDAKHRLVYIDVAKGIGILLVVIAHHIQDMPLLRWWINSFHMPLVVELLLLNIFCVIIKWFFPFILKPKGRKI